MIRIWTRGILQWIPLVYPMYDKWKGHMNATKFKRQAETLIGGLRHLIKKMPQKGNIPTECQRITLLEALNGLVRAVNGVKDEDFIEDNHNENK